MKQSSNTLPYFPNQKLFSFRATQKVTLTRKATSTTAGSDFAGRNSASWRVAGRMNSPSIQQHHLSWTAKPKKRLIIFGISSLREEQKFSAAGFRTSSGLLGKSFRKFLKSF